MRTGTVWLLLLLAQATLAQPVQQVSTQLAPPTSGDGAAGDNLGVAMAVDGPLAVVGVFGDTVVAAGAGFGVAQGSVTLFALGAGGWTQTQKLSPDPPGDSGDNFGASVALAGGVLAVGAPRSMSGSMEEVGSVHLYVQAGGGFVPHQILVPSVPSTDLRFGTAVALWQDQLAIGVARDGAGRVDLYRRGADGFYSYQQSLAPAAGIGAARFGSALAVADAELLIGAPQADGTGAVYASRFSAGQWGAPARLPLFADAGAQLGAALAQHAGLGLVGAPGVAQGEVRVIALGAGGWSPSGALAPPALLVGDRFGSALALDGQRAAVAAEAAFGYEGRVLAYARSGQSLTALSWLDQMDGGSGDRFGASVALAAGGVLVGADLDQVGPNRGQGAAYWYRDNAGTLELAGRLDNGDGAMYDRFATSVAIDGDLAVAGAYLEDTLAGADAGAAHWFRREGEGWVHAGRLEAPDAEVDDRFGIAVDISGDRIAVGAYWDVINGNVDQGSVYVFRRQGTNWVFEQKLVGPDGDRGDYFGFALALEGDLLAVGARGDSDAALEQGAVHVFHRGAGGWKHEARLVHSQFDAFAYFGASVALCGESLLVGAPGATLEEERRFTGAAFTFERAGGSWPSRAVLKPVLPQENAGFGFAVAADCRHLLVGAFQQGELSTGMGFLYRAQDGAWLASLRSPDPQPGEFLGIAVALVGDRALLGAPGFDQGGAFSVGRVLVFAPQPAGGWALDHRLMASDAAGGDGFGRVLAGAAGAGVIIAAPSKGGANPLEGRAYVTRFERLHADGFE